MLRAAPSDVFPDPKRFARTLLMPLYSYRCSACDGTFETLVRSGETPACPSCGSQALDKLLSKPAPDAKSGRLLAAGRAAAAREGHFSNYSRAETKGKV